MDKDFFNLLFNHLEERRYNNVCQNAKQDAGYLKATHREQELSNCYVYRINKETLYTGG